MRAISLLLLTALPLGAQVTPPLIDAIIQIESSGRASAIGDSGAAMGLAQFHRGAWQDTTAYRRSKGLITYPYTSATLPGPSRAYLDSWLTLNADRFLKATGRVATPGDLYAIHNLGFSGFQKRGFDILRCPSITRRKAQIITGRTDK